MLCWLLLVLAAAGCCSRRCCCGLRPSQRNALLHGTHFRCAPHRQRASHWAPPQTRWRAPCPPGTAPGTGKVGGSSVFSGCTEGTTACLIPTPLWTPGCSTGAAPQHGSSSGLWPFAPVIYTLHVLSCSWHSPAACPDAKSGSRQLLFHIHLHCCLYCRHSLSMVQQQALAKLCARACPACSPATGMP